MSRRVLLLGVVLALGAGSGVARGGAWTSYMHTYSFSELVAVGDTVWCATREAGLLRFDASSNRFDTFFREPGGLISNELTALTFDRSGRLWAGTRGEGVSRLSPDRKTWDLLSVFDGLPSDTITVIEAKGDTVYIGTSAGIALWDGNSIAGAIPDGVNPSPFANNFVTGVVQLGDSVWVSTPNGIYVSRLSAATQTWDSENQGLFSSRSLGLATDGSSLFTYGDNLAYKFKFDTGQWAVVGDKNVIGDAERLAHGNGVVTLATSTGIYRWNPLAGPAGDWEPIQTGGPYGSGNDPADTRAVFAVAFDPGTGTAYAANVNGLRVLAPGCSQCPLFSPPGPPGNNIINLALQPLSLGSQIYVNTFDEGVGRFDGGTWRIWPSVLCTQGCDTTFEFPVATFAIQATPNGKKWVACWSGPLEEFDDAVSPPSFTHHREAWDQEPLNPERHSFGWATAVDPAGGIWISLETNGAGGPPVPPALGIDYYDPNGVYMRNYRPDNTNVGAAMRGGQIRGLTIDHRGRFWVGYTGQGVQYFDWPIPAPPAAPDFFTVNGTQSFYIQSLRTYGDSLWVLTDKDLRRYDARSTNPAPNSVFTPPGETVQNAIRPLEVGPDGSVWLGTSNGVRIYHPGGRVEDFKASNSPLVSDGVRAIVVEPRTGVAWIGTSAGLNRYDPHYVPPSAAPIQSLRVSIRPNPMTLTAIGAPLLVSGDGDLYDGAVYDLNGRVVSRFTRVRDGQAFWNGRDERGVIVKPGIYFVRVTSKGHSATARVAVVR